MATTISNLTEDPGYNQSFADIWSLAHAGTGILAGLFEVPPLTFIALQVAYEIFEQGFENRYLKRPESAKNILGDLTIATGAYVATRYFIEDHFIEDNL